MQQSGTSRTGAFAAGAAAAIGFGLVAFATGVTKSPASHKRKAPEPTTPAPPALARGATKSPASNATKSPALHEREVPESTTPALPRVPPPALPRLA